MKTYKVIFKGRKRHSAKDYSKQTVRIEIDELHKLNNPTGVLPELNKNWEVYELIEIWELIF